MKQLALVIAAFSFVLSGCTFAAKDLRSTAGGVGSIFDRHYFDASGSKDLVLLRASLVVAMVARGGTVYARDTHDGAAYVDYLVGTADELNILASHLYSYGEGSGLACQLPLAKDYEAKWSPGDVIGDVNYGSPSDKKKRQPDAFGCLTYRANFESNLPIIERKVFKLVGVSLPRKEAEKFADALTSGGILSKISAALAFASKSAEGLHSGAAVHRTSLEILARQYKADARKCDKSEFETVTDAAICLDIPSNQLWIGRRDQRDHYHLKVMPQTFSAIMANIRESCKMVSDSAVDFSLDQKALQASKVNVLRKCNSIRFVPHPRWMTPDEVNELAPKWQNYWHSKYS